MIVTVASPISNSKYDLFLGCYSLTFDTAN